MKRYFVDESEMEAFSYEVVRNADRPFFDIIFSRADVGMGPSGGRWPMVEVGGCSASDTVNHLAKKALKKGYREVPPEEGAAIMARVAETYFAAAEA